MFHSCSSVVSSFIHYEHITNNKIRVKNPKFLVSLILQNRHLGVKFNMTT